MRDLKRGIEEPVTPGRGGRCDGNELDGWV